MKATVMSIKSEKDIEDEVVPVSEADSEEKPTRSKIARLGNKLVDTTELVLKGVKKFIALFNKSFNFVTIECFVFEEADYAFVSEKEVREVRDIFRAFEIDIRQMREFKKGEEWGAN